MNVVFGQPSLFPTQPPSDTVATTVFELPRLPQLAVLSEGISLLRNAFDPAKIFDAINSVAEIDSLQKGATVAARLAALKLDAKAA